MIGIVILFMLGALLPFVFVYGVLAWLLFLPILMGWGYLKPLVATWHIPKEWVTRGLLALSLLCWFFMVKAAA